MRSIAPEESVCQSLVMGGLNPLLIQILLLSLGRIKSKVKEAKELFE